MRDTTLISLRIPNDLLADLDRIATEENRSRAQVIVMRLSKDYRMAAVQTLKRAMETMSAHPPSWAPDHAETCDCLMCQPPK